jgi:hypothetical protein
VPNEVEAKLGAMQASPSSSPMSLGERSPSSPFNVVIVYEDFTTGTRAQKGCDLLAREFGEECEFKHSLWRADLLENPQLKTCIMDRVTKADLLIISVHSKLRPGMSAVINAWVTEKEHRDSVLMVVFDQAEARSFQRNLAFARLSMLAQRCRLDFFEQTVGGPDEDTHVEKLKLVWIF